MKRRPLLLGLGALGLTEALGLLRTAWAAGRPLPPPGIHRLSGEVRLNGQPAKPGMLVKPGDTLETGPGSEVIFIIGQDAFLQRDRSVVSILGDQVKSGLRVLNGKLLSVFGKGSLTIETATATIGIRGTACYIESVPDKVYFCLCYGVAEIRPKRAPDQIETIRTSYHDFPVYLPASGPTMLQPTPEVINHTDAELVLLEALVGRTPPFLAQTGGAFRY